MPSLRRLIAKSNHPVAKAAKALYYLPDTFSLPVPGWMMKPALYSYIASREAVYFARRVFIAEPFFRSYVKSHGKNLHTGVSIHWIEGAGDIILGDNVTFDGKSGIKFAARFVDRPLLKVGNNVNISGGCTLTIGKAITIGNDCRLASDIVITDSNGHPAEPVSRKEGAPPADDQVRPVTIQDNVWIGRRAIILPGVTIGEGSIVSSGAIVMNDIAPYTVVAGNPARKIGNVPRPDGAPAPTAASPVATPATQPSGTT